METAAQDIASYRDPTEWNALKEVVLCTVSQTLKSQPRLFTG